MCSFLHDEVFKKPLLPTDTPQLGIYFKASRSTKECICISLSNTFYFYSCYYFCFFKNFCLTLYALIQHAKYFWSDSTTRELPLLGNYFGIFFITIFWLCWVLVAACGIKFRDQGLNPGPLRWECGVSATGQPRNPCLSSLNTPPPPCPYSFTKMTALSLQGLSNLLLSSLLTAMT